MKHKLWLVLVGTSFLVGCTITAHLYPVQGPLSAQSPLPVFSTKLSGTINPRTISATLSNGEICKGNWIVIPQARVQKGSDAATTINDLAPIWDTVYGTGYYVSHALGSKYYDRAVATGNKGTVLTMELYVDSGDGDMKGVAKDNHENIYKVVF